MIQYGLTLCLVAIFIYPIARVEELARKQSTIELEQEILVKGMSDLKTAQDKLEATFTAHDSEATEIDHHMEQYEGTPLPDKYKRSTLEDHEEEKPRKKKKQKATFIDPYEEVDEE